MEKNNREITGTLRILEGDSYTFSVKAFKSWKIKFKREYLNLFGNSITQDFPDSHTRETLYKTIFNIKSIDVFGSGRNCTTIDQFLLDRANQVHKILQYKK